MPFPYFFSISCLLGILCLVFPYKCSSFPQQHAFFSPLTRYSHSLPSPTPSSVTPHSHIPFLSLPSFFQSLPILSSLMLYSLLGARIVFVGALSVHSACKGTIISSNMQISFVFCFLLLFRANIGCATLLPSKRK